MFIPESGSKAYEQLSLFIGLAFDVPTLCGWLLLPFDRESDSFPISCHRHYGGHLALGYRRKRRRVLDQ
jgi:hypothetical protein